MQTVEIVLYLILLILLSDIINNYVVSIPVSFIQIILGLLSALFGNIEINLNSDWFLLLFIAPLLFNDGKNFPRRALRRLRFPIFYNAIFLVFFTTIVGGYLIHLVVPALPLVESFTLAAILSPTDPVAVRSMAQRVNLPRGVTYLVSGESLINDASGLVAFKYALAASVTGVFSFTNAAGNFIYISIVGSLAGIILVSLFRSLEQFLEREDIADVIFYTIFNIITPFIIYYISEDLLKASGVISVVTAGVFSQFFNKNIEYRPELKLLVNKSWNVINYVLNGLVFLLLGNALPNATRRIIRGDSFNTFQAILYAFLAWVILSIIRVIWIFVYQRFTRRKTKILRDLRISLLAALSGVRGAVTMVGVLSIPVYINSKKLFPQRDLILFIAAGVIIISFLVAMVTLPFITKNRNAVINTRANTEETIEKTQPKRFIRGGKHLNRIQALLLLLQVGISTIDSHSRERNQEAAYELISDYQFLERSLEMRIRNDKQAKKEVKEEIDLSLIALRGEKEALYRLRNQKQISHISFENKAYQLRRQKKQIKQISPYPTFSIIQLLRRLRIFVEEEYIIWFRSKKARIFRKESRLIKRETSKSAIKSLSKHVVNKQNEKDQINHRAVYALIIQYRNRIENTKRKRSPQNINYRRQTRRLQVQSLNAQRNYIQTLLERGNIDYRLANNLRQYINYSENNLSIY